MDPTSGNVYVTGHSTGSGGDLDYATIGYRSSGVRLGIARYDGPGDASDRAEALALDADGNLHVTGASTRLDSGVHCSMTIAYGRSGAVRWSARGSGPVPTSVRANGIVVDSDRQAVYVSGSRSDSGETDEYDFFTQAWSTAGAQLWTATGYDYATAGYSSSGTRLWAAHFDAGQQLDGARAITVDSSTGTVYVTGQSYAGLAGWDAATLAYADGGVQLWHSRFGGRTGSGTPYGIAVDPDTETFTSPAK